MVILVDPLAGIMGYVGAHAVEYFVIVHQSLGRRYARSARPMAARIARAGGAGPTGPHRLLRRLRRHRRSRIVTVLARLGSPLAYLVVFFTLGGLHVFYDGFIWKLRRPVVADSLAIDASLMAS